MLDVADAAAPGAIEPDGKMLRAYADGRAPRREPAPR